MTEPAWSGLFSGAPFEFRFGARPGDPEGFFKASSEYASRVQLRREIVREHPARHVFHEAGSRDAVAELIRWAGLEGGGCLELALHWEQAAATDDWIIQGETGLLRRRQNGSVERALKLATFDGPKIRSGPLR